MGEFNFTYLVDVRYGDLDPQGHVNNANFLTYLEQARVKYLIQLGLFTDDQSFWDVGIILAEAQITFLTPILYGMHVQVEVRVTRLGNKSMDMIYRMVDEKSGTILAKASTVLVTFDYRSGRTILIPDLWRERITSFESL